MGKFRFVSLAVFSLSLICCISTDCPASQKRYTRNDLYIGFSRYNKTTADLLSAGKYADLEAKVVKLRTGKDMWISGRWKLCDFYDAFASEMKGLPAEKWNQIISLLKAWHAAFPASPAPLIALAKVYFNYAYEARGVGYASTITEQGERDMKARLAVGWKYIGEARVMAIRDPVVQETALFYGILMGLERNKMEELLAEGLKIDERYFYLYLPMVQYLLPRWGGKPGDWQAYILWASGNGKNPEIYARCAAFAFWYEGFKAKDLGLDWPLLCRGYEILMKKYPRYLAYPNEYCYVACIAGEMELVNQIMVVIGEDWDPDVWKKRESFDSCRVKSSGGVPQAVPAPMNSQPVAAAHGKYDGDIRLTFDPASMPVGARSMAAIWIPVTTPEFKAPGYFQYMLDRVEGEDILDCIPFGEFTPGRPQWGKWLNTDTMGDKFILGNSTFVARRDGRIKVKACLKGKNGEYLETSVVQVVVGEPKVKGKDIRGRRLNVAILDVVPQGANKNDAVFVTELLRNQLASKGTMNVIDSGAMQKIMAEKQYQEAGCTSEDCAIRIGRLLKADYVIIGRLDMVDGVYTLTAGLSEVEVEKRRASFQGSSQPVSVPGFSLIWKSVGFRDSNSMNTAVADIEGYMRERMP